MFKYKKHHKADTNDRLKNGEMCYKQEINNNIKYMVNKNENIIN